MSQPSASTHSAVTRSLWGIFFFSGFASLVYQVVWQRMLTIYYGVGPLSITLIVSVYMLGLGIGALYGGKLAEGRRNLVQLYFIIELLLGAFGIASIPLLQHYGELTAGSGYLFSTVNIFLLLCIPTFLMGMTLPLLVKIFSYRFHDLADNLSRLYFINTLGAAAGAAACSYVLISCWGLDYAAWIAAGINIVLALLIFRAGRGYQPVVPAEPASGHVTNGNKRLVFLFVFVSGFLAIAYEIAWFRISSVLVKSSVYAFSSILAVYLLGIAAGSYRMNRRLRKKKVTDRRQLFFRLQAGIGLYVLVSIAGWYYLTKYTPLAAATKVSFGFENHPPLHFDTSTMKATLISLFTSMDIFFWPLFFVFIPSVLMGGCFPLIASLADDGSGHSGRTTGRIYFVNIMGNVAGGLLTGLLLLPVIGTERTLALLVSVSLMSVLLIRSGKTGKVKALLAGGLLILAALAVFPRKGEIWQTMHIIADKEDYEAYYEEGLDGVCATFIHGKDVRNYINGLAHGGRPATGFYFMTTEALCSVKNPEQVLVIGYGTGSVTEAALKHPSVKKVTLVELSETLMSNLKKSALFRRLLADERIELIIDDGRRWLQQHPEAAFDAVLIDPVRTSTAYSNNLYSTEFFTLVKERLRPGGVFLSWRDEHHVMLHTLAAVYPEVRVYDYFSIASEKPFQPDSLLRDSCIAAFDSAVQGGLRGRIGSTYLGNRNYALEQAKNFPVNRDVRPVCEYYLGNK